MRILAVVAMLTLSLGAAVMPVQGTHEEDCSGDEVRSCGGHVGYGALADPGYWTRDEWPGDTNRPHWILLRSPTGTDIGDVLKVDVTVTGTIVGSVDVFEAREDFDGSSTADWQTPRCPQEYVYDVLPGHDGAASPSHLLWVKRLTLDNHQMATGASPSADVDLSSISIELPRERDWVVVIDARLASTHVDSDETSGIDYDISVGPQDARFRAFPLPVPDRPVDTRTWAVNAQACEDDFRQFLMGLDPTSTPELPGLGSGDLDLSDLFGAEL